MKINIFFTNQINEDKILYFLDRKNFLLKAISNEDEVFVLDLNQIEENKVYLSNKFILRASRENEEFNIKLLNKVSEEDYINEVEGEIEETDLSNEEINFQLIDNFTDLDTPFLENENLKLEIQQLQNRIIQENKKNERAQLEMLELIMSMM